MDGENRGAGTVSVTGGSAQGRIGREVADKAKQNNPNHNEPTRGAPRRQIQVRSCPGVAVPLGTMVSPARGGPPSG